MGYVLLSVEHVAFWLFTAALVTALGTRIQGRWRRSEWIVGALILPLSIIVLVNAWVLLGIRGAVPVAYVLLPPVFQNDFFQKVMVVFSLAWIGALAIVFRGLKRDVDGQLPGRRWRVDLLAYLTGGVLLVHFMTFWNLDIATRQQLESIRVESGAVAVSLAPLVVPDRDNAAFVYQEVMESGMVGNPTKEYEQWFETLMKDPAALPVDDPLFVAYVKGHAAIVARIRHGTELSVCNFRRDWGRPSFAMLLPETQNLRWCATELLLSAHYRAAHGEMGAALQDLLAIHRLADHAGQEPILVSLLVSIALDHLAAHSLEYLLQTYPVTAADIALLDAWRPNPSSIRCQRALRMEEAFGLASFCQIAIEDGGFASLAPVGGPSWPAPLTTIYRVFFLTEDLRTYRQFMTRAQNAAIVPHRQRVEVWNATTKDLRDKPVGLVSRLLLPAQEPLNVAIVRADTTQRLAQVAIAMHAYRVEHGDFPQSLSELDAVPLVMRDPYNEEPLRMTRRDDTVVVYSVGPNLTDDQGVKGERDATGAPTGDSTFVLKAPRVAEKVGE